MTETDARLRDARADDIEQLSVLWASLFDQSPPLHDAWEDNARVWFASVVDDLDHAVLPVVEEAGQVVACAIGTLEVGCPTPYSPRGRGVRLMNVATHPEHRRQGYGTRLLERVVAWAYEVGADRIDLSATPEGRRIYERAGFTLVSAPRMKRHL